MGAKRFEITGYLRGVLPTYEPGDLLPTIAELCDRFDVRSPTTIRSAYEPLIRAGLVAVRRVEPENQLRFVLAAAPTTDATIPPLDQLVQDAEELQLAAARLVDQLRKYRAA